MSKTPGEYYLNLPEDTAEQVFFKIESLFEFKARFTPISVKRNDDQTEVELDPKDMKQMFDNDILKRVKVLVIKYYVLMSAAEADIEEQKT